MDQIYSQAQLTIIAAAPGDGLLGIRGSLRKPQPALMLGDWAILSTLRHPQISVEMSKWMTRGWTYQEGLISKRRLVFTEDQVFFECNGMSCTESISFPFNTSKSSSDFTYGDKTRLEAFEFKTPGDKPWDFMKYVAEFYRRELTFHGDALNAMEGIFRIFSQSRRPVYNYLGIPIIPNHSRDSGDDSPDSAARSAKACFVLGLCWKHEEYGTRMSLFPSWTWAG